MIPKIPLEEGEEIIFWRSCDQSGSNLPFNFAASKTALFVSRGRLIGKKAEVLDRLPLSEIEAVLLIKDIPISLWMAAGVLVLGGMTLTVLMIISAWSAPVDPWAHLSVVPLIIIAFGAGAPLIAGRRRTLIVKTKDTKPYKWKPGLLLIKEKVLKIEDLQEDILKFCGTQELIVFTDKKNDAEQS